MADLKFEASKGQSKLAQLVQSLFPNKLVEQEHYIQGFRYDVFVPHIPLVLEYHGRQHFEYVDFFHTNQEGFLDMQLRDKQKEELCEEHGIAYAVFRYDEELDLDSVYEAVKWAMETVDEDAAPPKTYEERVQEHRRERNRERYQEAKRYRKRRP